MSDAWKLKLRILRQQLVEDRAEYRRIHCSYCEGAGRGLMRAIYRLDEMLGQTEEERNR